MVLAKKVLAVKVLVIEDDPHVAGFLVKALREAGASVDHAADGKEGLFLASAAPHDVMVVDRMLPGLDGLAIVPVMIASATLTPQAFSIPSRPTTIPSELIALRASSAPLMALRASFNTAPCALRASGSSCPMPLDSSVIWLFLSRYWTRACSSAAMPSR